MVRLTLALLLAAPAWGQVRPLWPIVQSYTIGGATPLPAAGVKNRIAFVTNAASIASCTVGGGSVTVLCRDDGTAWAPAGDGPGALTFSTLTDGATITWAIASVPISSATVTLGGSRTLNITGPVNGGSYVLRIVQDGTGSRGLTLGTGCAWKVSGGGAGAITPSTAANSIDILAFTYDGTNCYANFNKNFN